MIIAALPALTLLGAALTLVIPAAYPRALQTIARLTTAGSLALVLFLCFRWSPATELQSFSVAWNFFPEMGIRYQVGLDGIGLVFCLLLGLVACAGIEHAINQTTSLKPYLSCYLFLISSMFAVFTVQNVFFLYLFYEMTLIPIFIMMAIAGPSAQREQGALRLALYMTAGAMLGLLALLALYKTLGPNFLDLTLASNLLAEKSSLLTPNLQKILAALLIVGFGIMTSLFPFHSWSPAVYSGMPTSLAMVHAGVKMGPYILLRIAVTYLPEGFRFWGPTLAVLASLGILYGAFVAIRQKSLRPLAAFSSISHMGTVFLAFATMTSFSISAGLFLVFAHGLMIALFFFLIGILENRAQTDEIDAFGGMGKIIPLFSVALMLTSLASCGIPGFANFPAELLVFLSAWKSFPLAVGVAVFGVLMTAVYMIRAAQAICFGPENPHFSNLRDLSSFSEKFSFFILISALVGFGIYPVGILRFISPVVETLLK